METSTCFALCLVLAMALFFNALPAVQAQWGMSMPMGMGWGRFGGWGMPFGMGRFGGMGMGLGMGRFGGGFFG